MNTDPRMPCANCNHTADEHMQAQPMRCLYGPATYKPIERLAFRAWCCSMYPKHPRTGSFKTIFVDDGQLYAAEDAQDNEEYIVFNHVGPVGPSFYERRG